ncbi:MULTISPECIES: GNAT family N-acetyltransferase [unclassified Sphingobium]|uniref:GNAT family N-acetyltransferase n=1 Tax=unclassified Sphingobium TaxID=2611147 RepID=UPI002224112F|nr:MULTISPECIES: GNAT family N-acetyltransferase [unclassified Sphingobium]MCW2411060.1 putative acetyltransferase [Sphingobium sp. B8D3D]MCW2416648.1 putative acetyltransferase [Sphingobium sp. B8D3A]
MPEPLRLVMPAPIYLPAYRAALEAGWSPDTVLGNLATQRELDRIDRDAMAFLLSLDDPKAKGPPVLMKDGTPRPRLPGYRRWMWDGEFCGSISLRWQEGTAAMPDYCPGHIGFSVVPWKRGHGYAAQALGALLPEARGCGLPHVDLTTNIDNDAARRTIERCGGILVDHVEKDAGDGGGSAARYRIMLG